MMKVEGVVSGGPELTVAVFSFVLLVLLVLNWGSIFRFLFNGEKSESSVASVLSNSISRIKISLLKFSGASTHDLSSDNGQYLTANQIQRTYFAQHKLKCFWQLFSYYMLYCLILVFLAKPIDVNASEEAGRLVAYGVSKDAPSQIINIAILAIVNVATDLLSLTITFINLTRIGAAFDQSRYSVACGWAAIDVVVAMVLFTFSQLVSNILYPKALDNPPTSFDPWTIEAALMPYAFLESVVGNLQAFYPVTFPGQLFITGTVFLPTLAGMALVIVVTLLFAMVRLAKRIQDVYLGKDDVDATMSPEPIAGLAVNTTNRADKCLQFAVGSMMSIVNAFIAGIMVLAIGSFMGLI